MDGGIPEEARIGKKVKYSFLNIFCCEPFVHIYRENITNLEEKSKKCRVVLLDMELMILVITYGIMKSQNN